MSAEAVAELYMRMDDDDQLREQLAAGSFGDADLDDDERGLVRLAAIEALPEVIPFAQTLPMPGRHAAIDYIGKNLSSPQAQANWVAFFDQRQLAHIAPGL